MGERYIEGKAIPTTDWTLGKKLGEGSYGKVYEVFYREGGFTNRAAVKIISIPRTDEEIKLLRSKKHPDEAIRRTFAEKADYVETILKKLKDKRHIVRYEQYFRLPHEDGIGVDLVIRMEILTPLLDYMAGRDFDAKEAARLGYYISAALEECQSERIVHQDIKPGNILVTEDGEYKLSDFSVAHVMRDEQTSRIRDGAEEYMAPEVYLQKPYNARADIYSLGLLLYSFLERYGTEGGGTDSGIPSWEKKEKRLKERFKGKPLPPLKIDPDLRDIIRTACAYKPKDRYPNPATMREDFQYYLADAPIFWWKPLRWKLAHPQLLKRQRQYYAQLPPVSADAPDGESAAPESSQKGAPETNGVLLPFDAPASPVEPPPRPAPPPSGKLFAGVAAAVLVSLCLLVALALYLWPAPLEGLALDPDPLRATVGDELRLNVLLSPKNAAAPEIEWTSDAETVAVVNGGVVTATGPGAATITAQSGEFTAQCAVEVESVVDGVTLDREEVSLYTGESVQLSAALLPSDAQAALTWTSADEDKAVVEDDGTVTARNPGSTVVRATAGGQDAVCLVTVTPEPPRLWSEWLEALPDDLDRDAYEIEEKTQYSSQSRQTRESAYPSIEGWSLVSQSDSYGEYGDWTDWSASAVSASDTTQVETKTQYRSRTKETRQSAYPSIEGWTRTDTSASYGDYGSWSDWTTSAASSSDTRQVQTKTQYRSRTRETRQSSYPSIEGWTRVNSSSSYGDYGAWSDWTTSPVSSSETTQAESKKQYRSRTRQTTTSSSSSLSGWTRVSSSSSYGDYGGWSDWTTSAASSSDTVRVETKTQYRYRDKQTTTNSSSSLSGWTRVSGPNYGAWGGTQTSSSRPSESETLQVTGSKQVRWGYYHYCNKYENGGNGWNVDSVAWGGISSTRHSTTASFALPGFSMPDKGGQQPYGGMGTGAAACPYNFYVWFRDSSQDAYEYYYQTRSVSYGFEKWGDWSSWSDSSVSKSDSRDVETRTLYRTSSRQQNTTYTFEKWGDWSAWSDSSSVKSASQPDSIEWDTRTVYRSRTRTVNYTYTFERWGDWSAWSDSEISATSTRDTQSRTLYRSRTRTVTYTYTFEKWGDWSAWSDSEISSTSTRDAQSRTLYRSRTRSKTTTYTHEQWGPWSDYGDTPIPESESVKVRMRTLYRYREQRRQMSQGLS